MAQRLGQAFGLVPVQLDAGADHQHVVPVDRAVRTAGRCWSPGRRRRRPYGSRWRPWASPRIPGARWTRHWPGRHPPQGPHRLVVVLVRRLDHRTSVNPAEQSRGDRDPGQPPPMIRTWCLAWTVIRLSLSVGPGDFPALYLPRMSLTSSPKPRCRSRLAATDDRYPPAQ